MRLMPAVAVLLVLAAALAGCAKPDPLRYPSPIATSSSHSAFGSATSSATATSTGAGNGTGNQTGNATNHAPTGTISVVVNGTLASFNLTGQDSDNDTLSWTLSFGDGNQTNGTTLPATAAHNYTAAGNYTANFTVSDGHATAAYNVSIAVGSGGTVQSSSGSWRLGNPPICAGSQGTPYHPAFANSNGVTMLIVDLVPAAVGRPFTALFGDPGPGQQGAYVWFSNPSTISIKSFTASGSPPSATGVVPDGAEKAVFATCGPLGSSVTFTV